MTTRIYTTTLAALLFVLSFIGCDTSKETSATIPESTFGSAGIADSQKRTTSGIVVGEWGARFQNSQLGDCVSIYTFAKDGSARGEFAGRQDGRINFIGTWHNENDVMYIKGTQVVLFGAKSHSASYSAVMHFRGDRLQIDDIVYERQ